jgi:threonine aldolase
VAIVDLRSDTVTLPGEEMRRVMSSAEVGDDVFGEDPTVNRLQEISAERMGKEAAIFVPSGTMGNLVGVLLHARSGQEVIADADAHVFMYEAAGAAMVGGIQLRPIQSQRGVMHASQVRAAIRPRDDSHQPLTTLLCIENTHNRHGGVAWSIDELRSVTAVAREHGIPVHMDGARIFNAALAAGVPAAQVAAGADTITFCLSKGLGCPVGSVLCGPRALITQAERWRKMLGGGMRQAGVLAAAGIFALERMVDRLAEDHRNARTLAESLAEMAGIDCDLKRVQTNIVLAHLVAMDANRFLEECRRRGVLAVSMGGDSVRFVTHDGIDASQVQAAIQVVSEVLQG